MYFRLTGYFQDETDELLPGGSGGDLCMRTAASFVDLLSILFLKSHPKIFTIILNPVFFQSQHNAILDEL